MWGGFGAVLYMGLSLVTYWVAMRESTGYYMLLFSGQVILGSLGAMGLLLFGGACFVRSLGHAIARRIRKN